MLYNITQKAIDDGRFEEQGTIEIIAAVDGYTEMLIEQGYLEEVKTESAAPSTL